MMLVLFTVRDHHFTYLFTELPVNSPVIIHTGVLHPDLELGLFDLISRKKSEDKLCPIVILVGAAVVARRLERQMLMRGMNLFDIRFVTMTRLATDVSPLSSSRFLPMPRSGLTALSHFDFSGNPEDDPFNRVWEYPGFARALSRSFSDLEEAGIERLSAEWLVEPSKRATLDKRRKAFVELYREYRNRAAGYFTHSRQFAPLANSAKAFQDAYNAESLIVYGIYDMNEAEWFFLKSILLQVPTDYFFPKPNALEDEAPAYEFSKKLLERLKNEVDGKVNPVGNGVTPSASLFELKPKARWDGVDLAIVQSANPATEVEHITGQIAELVFYNQVDPADIGVVVWDASLYRPLFVENFKLAQLPLADCIGGGLGNTPVGRIAGDLVGFSAASIKRRELFDLIACKLIKLGLEEAKTSAFDIEKIGIDSGIIQGGAEAWANKLGRHQEWLGNSEKPGDRHRAEITGSIAVFVAELFAKLSALDKATGFETQVTAVISLLDGCLHESPELDAIIRELSGLTTLQNSGVKLNRSQFVAIVKETIQSAKIQTKQPDGGVELLSPLAARGVRFKYLFLPGMVQGAVPASSKSDSFLPDELRQRINQKLSGELNRPLVIRGLRIQEERLLFALALDSAEVRVTLSYPVVGLGNSKTQIPSRFLLEACKLKSGVQVDAESVRRLEYFNDLTQGDFAAGWERRLVRLGDYPLEAVKRQVESGNLRAALRNYPYATASWLGRLVRVGKSRSLGDRFTKYDGIVGDLNGIKNSDSVAFNVTDIEAWAACPFRYFITKRLGLEEWEEPEISIQPPATVTGKVIHNVLQKVYERAISLQKLPLRGDSLSWAKDEVTAILVQTKGRVRRDWPAPEMAYVIAEEMWRKRIIATLESLAEFDQGWEVKSLEEKIDLTLEVLDKEGIESRRLTLKGRIDRKDIGDGLAVRIVDYKTGKVEDPAKLLGGSHLQLPIYLMASINGLSEEARNRSQSTYIKIGLKGDTDQKGIDGKWLMEQWPEILNAVATISSGIERGIFPPLPIKSDECKSCRAKLACDERSRSSAEWRMTDPIAETLQALRYDDE